MILLKSLLPSYEVTLAGRHGQYATQRIVVEVQADYKWFHIISSVNSRGNKHCDQASSSFIEVHNIVPPHHVQVQWSVVQSAFYVNAMGIAKIASSCTMASS